MRGKFNLRFVFRTMGFLLIIESLCLMGTSLLSLYWGEDCADAILIGAVATFLSGLLLNILGAEEYEESVGKRESFLVVGLAWVVMSAFGMLPYYLSGEIPNITDAYFETMSGFSSTGATILEDIEGMSRGLLFWRSLTQWIGGIGIIVFALVLLPMVGGNASVLYEAEATGIVRQRFRPRIGQMAKRLFFSYLLLTSLLIVLLWLGPMNLFDSVCHAMTTISTGGFSTKGNSIGHWDSAYVESVIGVFMFVGGINFALIYYLLQGVANKIVKDEEFKWYLGLCVLFILIVGVGLVASGTISNVGNAFRASFFQVISVITTTCFTTADYTAWGAFFTFAFSMLMPFCACAGSTSGGMKIVRLIVLFKNAVNEFKKQVHPDAVLPVRLNGNVISNTVITKVLAFLFLYLTIIGISLLVFSLTGMGFVESIGTSISCMSNLGLAFDNSGIATGFADIPTFSKWYMSLLMLIGRLEIFTVLSLFMPAFWSR